MRIPASAYDQMTVCLLAAIAIISNQVLILVRASVLSASRRLPKQYVFGQTTAKTNALLLLAG